MKAREMALAIALTAPVLPGCWCSGNVPDNTPVEDPDIAPRVDQILIPDWPPTGTLDVVVATVSDDDGGLSEVFFDFKEVVSRDVSGSSATVSVEGQELGEGFGTLYVTAYDVEGGWADREVTDFLVDLSPPQADLVQSVVRRGEGVDLQIWGGDAWVLGGVQLTFGEVTVQRTLEPGYPSTLGVAWDVSLFTLPTTSFPEMSGKAILQVWDAAGNESTTEVDLTLDGTPPVASITSPAPGSSVSGLVTIEVQGSDESAGAVEIDVLVGGTPVATLPGSSGKVTVDVSEMAKGAVQIAAIARDVAGNTSAVAEVPVVIE